jgi:YHYH protein
MTMQRANRWWSTAAMLTLAALSLAACSSDEEDDAETPVAAEPSPPSAAQIPITDSWLMAFSGRYARVVETRDSFPVRTWPAAGLTDTSGAAPMAAYADVQLVRESATDVYISTTGLASHQMGPWYWNVNTLFGNWPRATGVVYRLPKTPVEVADNARIAVGLGSQGIWVNGVTFFNQLDGAQYITEAGREIQGVANAATFGQEPHRAWIRDAIPVEGPTFDASNAHQPPTGVYHYHSNPLALRFQLGDNVRWDGAQARYVEDTSRLRHSPILGWARDGYPIYGPYGYGNCTGAGVDVRRMRTGFVLRDGASGSQDLRGSGRQSVGKWAATLHAITTPADAQGRVALPATAYGPDVNAYFYLGRYIEDYEFLGDLGRIQGTDFDLDRHNGRTCVTPEFPNGTYAYYVTIDASGKAVFPYTVGRQFRGNPVGGAQGAVAITVPLTTVKTGLPNQPPAFKVTVDTPTKRVLEWPSAEGAAYVVESSADNGLTWTILATSIGGTSPAPDAVPGGSGYYALNQLMTSYTDNRTVTKTPMYRVNQPTLAPNQTTAVAATKGLIAAVAPATVTRGVAFRLSITLTGSQPITDFDPLSSVAPAAVELVSLDGATVIATATNVTRQLTSITGDMTVPNTVAAGTYMAVVRFTGLNPGAVALQSRYQSVAQTAGVAAAAIRPGVTYTDRPVVVD